MGYTTPNVESQFIYIISFYILYYSICLICHHMKGSCFCIMEWTANILLFHEQTGVNGDCGVLWIDKFRLHVQSTVTREHNFAVRGSKCYFLFRCCSVSHTLFRCWHWSLGGSSHHQCCHLPTQSMGCLHFAAGARHWSVGQACPVMPLAGVYVCRHPRLIQP